MQRVIKTTFKLKRGTKECWESKNPILAQAEPGFEIGTGKMKVGNGIDNWNLLSYLNCSDKGMFTSISKVKDYLYEIFYNEDLDFESAAAYYKAGEDPLNLGGCSSFRKGSLLGRNLDWVYSNQAEFIVHTPRYGARNASIGIAGGFNELTNDFVSSGKYSSLYKVLPFHMYDGINEYGVVVNTNVVPTDKGKNKVLPDQDSKIELSALMVVRYILDNFKTATEAVNYIRNHVTIYFSKEWHDMRYECHYMIADRNNTYCIEFESGHTVILDMTEGSNSTVAGKSYMTNFHLHNVVFNSDGSVYTPETQDDEHNAVDTNHVTEHGAGLERYNLIASNFAELRDKSSSRELLNLLKYTRAYSTSTDPSNPFWYSEYVTNNELTVKTPTSDFAEIVRLGGVAFENRNRESGTTWQTIHSIVYDIDEKSFSIIVQEDNEELDYKLPTNLISKTSELENDGEDGYHSFISELDIEDLRVKVGEIAEDYIKSTDYATYDKAGVVVFGKNYGITASAIPGQFNITSADAAAIEARTPRGTAGYGLIGTTNFDKAVKEGIIGKRTTLTAEQKQSAKEWLGIEDQDLSDYVKKTDYASTTSAGLVRFNRNYGIVPSTSGDLNQMLVRSATNENIHDRAARGNTQGTYGVIDTQNFDIAVQEALSRLESNQGSKLFEQGEQDQLSNLDVVVSEIQDLIPGNAGDGNELVDRDSLETELSNIRNLIPTEASVTNKLADRDFVNSAVSTETAYFMGTVDSVDDLENLEDLTNNDYAFVRQFKQDDPETVVGFDRYKYVDNGENPQWLYEYTLNNSSFTSDQWAAINSGISANDTLFIQNLHQQFESGKTLTTHDFTNAYKTKLDRLDESAENNVLESISLNGNILSADNSKNTNIETDGTIVVTDNNNVLKLANNVDVCLAESLSYGDANGYRKYRNGMMEQWGLSTSQLTTHLFTLLQPFKDAYYSVFIEPREVGMYFHYAMPIDKNQFQAEIRGSSTGAPMQVQFQWRAIGRWK